MREQPAVKGMMSPPARPATLALVGALGVTVCVAVLGQSVLMPSLFDTALLVVIVYVLILLALLLGQARGLAALWILLLLLWVLGVSNAVHLARGAIVEAGARLPGTFASWSLVGLPLLGVTALFLRARNGQLFARRSGAVALWVIWLGLLLVSAYLSSQALDVAPNPLHNVVVVSLAIGLLAPSPLVLSWWLAVRTWRMRRPSVDTTNAEHIA